MTSERRFAQTLSTLEREQLLLLSDLLSTAALVSQRTRDLGPNAPTEPAWRQASEQMEDALARAAALRWEVQSALELKAIAALPPGQRPTTWAGPSPAELFDMTTSWDRMYPMTWWQFEHLVAETFRRLEFEDVEVVEGGRDGDGGVDIRMSCKGAPCIVQVKHFAADAYVKIDKLRALSDRANREKATAYLVTSGQVGQTARRDMAKPDPQVFIVDGELLWKWMRKARGEQSDSVVFVPGQKLIQATSEPEGDATPSKPSVPASAKSGCLSVLVIAAALLVSLMMR